MNLPCRQRLSFCNPRPISKLVEPIAYPLRQADSVRNHGSGTMFSQHSQLQRRWNIMHLFEGWAANRVAQGVLWCRQKAWSKHPQPLGPKQESSLSRKYLCQKELLLDATLRRRRLLPDIGEEVRRTKKRLDRARIRSQKQRSLLEAKWRDLQSSSSSSSSSDSSSSERWKHWAATILMNVRHNYFNELGLVL